MCLNMCECVRVCRIRTAQRLPIRAVWKTEAKAPTPTAECRTACTQVANAHAHTRRFWARETFNVARTCVFNFLLYFFAVWNKWCHWMHKNCVELKGSVWSSTATILINTHDFGCVCVLKSKWSWPSPLETAYNGTGSKRRTSSRIELNWKKKKTFPTFTRIRAETMKRFPLNCMRVFVYKFVYWKRAIVNKGWFCRMHSELNRKMIGSKRVWREALLHGQSTVAASLRCMHSENAQRTNTRNTCAMLTRPFVSWDGCSLSCWNLNSDTLVRPHRFVWN